MSKVIAIIDKPSWCFECPFFRSGINSKCVYSNKFMNSLSLTSLPDWCKLKPVPEKHKEFSIEEYEFGKLGLAFTQGWNSCINEILGGEV